MKLYFLSLKRLVLLTLYSIGIHFVPLFGQSLDSLEGQFSDLYYLSQSVDCEECLSLSKKFIDNNSQDELATYRREFARYIYVNSIVSQFTKGIISRNKAMKKLKFLEGQNFIIRRKRIWDECTNDCITINKDDKSQLIAYSDKYYQYTIHTLEYFNFNKEFSEDFVDTNAGKWIHIRAKLEQLYIEEMEDIQLLKDVDYPRTILEFSNPEFEFEEAHHSLYIEEVEDIERVIMYPSLSIDVSNSPFKLIRIGRNEDSKIFTVASEYYLEDKSIASIHISYYDRKGGYSHDGFKFNYGSTDYIKRRASINGKFNELTLFGDITKYDSLGIVGCNMSFKSKMDNSILNEFMGAFIYHGCIYTFEIINKLSDTSFYINILEQFYSCLKLKDE